MMGLGGSGGGRDDSGDQDEEGQVNVPPGQETLIDESDSESKSESEDTDEGGKTGAASAAGAAAGAAGSSGGATGGAGGGAAGGGAAGGGAGTGGSTGDGEESEESSDEEDGARPEGGVKGEPSKESEEEDCERERSSSEDHDAQNDQQEPDSDYEDVEDSEDAEDGENSEEDDEEDDEDEEPQDAELVVYTDAWDAIGWGIEPTLKRLDNDFGISFDLSYEILPPRELDREDHETAANRYEMPYADLKELPKNTANSTKALQLSKELDADLFRDYLRRLRIAALVKEESIEDESVLINLAEEIGFESDRFKQLLGEADAQTVRTVPKAPVMEGTAGDQEVFWAGNLEYGLAFSVLIDNDVPPLKIPVTPTQFISEHEPVTTAETTEALGISEDQLADSETVRRVKFGGADFWESCVADESDTTD